MKKNPELEDVHEFLRAYCPEYADRYLINAKWNKKEFHVGDRGDSYVPQFDSDCPIPKDGELLCKIPKERMSNVHSYREHQNHTDEPNHTKAPAKHTGNYNWNNNEI